MIILSAFGIPKLHTSPVDASALHSALASKLNIYHIIYTKKCL